MQILSSNGNEDIILKFPLQIYFANIAAASLAYEIVFQ